MTEDVEELEEVTDVAAVVVYNPRLHEFLVMQRSSDRDVFPGYWEFPSGIIEDGEKPRKTARRELKEETGLSGNRVKTGDEHVQETEYGDFRVHPFLFTVESDAVDVTLEHQDYMWIRLEEIEDLKSVPGLLQDLKAVGVER